MESHVDTMLIVLLTILTTVMWWGSFLGPEFLESADCALDTFADHLEATGQAPWLAKTCRNKIFQVLVSVLGATNMIPGVLFEIIFDAVKWFYGGSHLRSIIS